MSEPWYQCEGPSCKYVCKDIIKSLKLNAIGPYIFKCHDTPSVDGVDGIVYGSWHRVFKHYDCIHPSGCYNELSKIIIDNEEFIKIVKSHVNAIDSFGSWRGYYTFKKNIMDEYKKKIYNDMDILYERKKAYSILNEKFTPYISHWLYKPNGPRMRATMKTTLVGKDFDVNTVAEEYNDDEGKCEDDPRNGKYYKP